MIPAQRRRRLTDAEKRAKRRKERSYEAPDMAAFVGRTLRAMVRRAGNGDREVLPALAQIQRELDDAMGQAAQALRARGCSWTDVARELGVTRQAAQKRWGDVVLRGDSLGGSAGHATSCPAAANGELPCLCGQAAAS